MTGKSAVSIDDDLSSRKTGVSLRSSDYETACRIYIYLGITVNQFGRDDRCNDLLLNELLKFFARDVGAVLSGDNDRIDPLNLVAVIFNCNLRLSVRS